MPPTAQHIVIIFHDFSFGGTEVVALRLAADWIKQGRQVTILCGTIDGPLCAKVPRGVKVKALEPEIGRSLFSRLRLRRLLGPEIDHLRPDVVFLPGNFHLVLAGAVRGLSKPPLVVAKISNPLAPASFAPLRWIIQFAYRRVARDADWLVAMSTGLAKEAEAMTAKHKIVVIFDPNVETHAPPVAPKKGRMRGGRLNMLAAGRLVRQKDFALAIRMLSQMSRSRDVQLTILGEGPERPRLERLARRLGVSDRLLLPGQVPTIVPALRQADVLLVTSRYEGGPAVATEALEQGVPVIATNCSHFLRDLLEDDKAGIVIDTRNAAKLAKGASDWLDRNNQPFAPHDLSLARYEITTVSKSYLRLFDQSCH